GLIPATLAAQGHDHAPARGLSFQWGAQALGLVTHATPAERGRDLTEGYLTQPNLYLHGQAGVLRAQATLNLEGLSLRRGELNAGTWGEGYVDRRHPHTYLHEAMVTAAGARGKLSASLASGKGFAPFGTDDPMARPFLKFPANHHLAQVLERLVLIGGLSYGPVVLEVGSFNGDEPLSPRSLGTTERFGDSWSARLSVRPIPGLELQASRADLESPEQREGNALDQRKWSAALRYQQDDVDGARYLLLEWAHTTELNEGATVVTVPSLLAEAALRRGAWRGGLRLERTLRPEAERAGSVFRYPWPHGDMRIWGLTRWVLATGNVGRDFQMPGIRVAPVLEVSRQWGRPTIEPAFFPPELMLGGERLWSVSLGVRIGAGVPHARMGRYGVAQ
ncbi:MAG: hypothetical protein ACREMA_03940, partial [Longimicrobiales bacterium]